MMLESENSPVICVDKLGSGLHAYKSKEDLLGRCRGNTTRTLLSSHIKYWLAPTALPKFMWTTNCTKNSNNNKLNKNKNRVRKKHIFFFIWRLFLTNEYWKTSKIHRIGSYVAQTY